MVSNNSKKPTIIIETDKFYKNFRPITKKDVYDYQSIHSKYIENINLLKEISKHFKILEEDLTDKNIQYYFKYKAFDKRGIIDYLYYRDFKNKIPLERLTIEKIQKRFWDKNNKKWLPIPIHDSNGGNPTTSLGISGIHPLDFNNEKKVFYMVFTPNGNLVEKYKDKITIYKNWLEDTNSTKLSSKNSINDKLRGPYTKKDKNKSLDKFYYLDGTVEFDYDGKKLKNIGYKICTGPILNSVSYSCVNGSSWIRKEIKRTHRKKTKKINI